jgi:hypothetical protein
MGDNPFEADDDDNPFADKGAADDYNPFDDSMFDKKVQRLPLFSSFARPSLCGRHTHFVSQSRFLSKPFQIGTTTCHHRVPPPIS